MRRQAIAAQKGRAGPPVLFTPAQLSACRRARAAYVKACPPVWVAHFDRAREEKRRVDLLLSGGAAANRAAAKAPPSPPAKA